MKEQIATKDVTPEVIEKWKKEYGADNLFKYLVESDEGKQLVAFCRKPTRKIISYSSAVQNDVMKSNEVLVNGCWLAGDEAIKTDDKLFLGLTKKLSSFYEPVTGELVKL